MSRTLAEWLTYIERQHPKSIDMGLERVRDVATRLGLGRPAAHVVTVGGTNGKGSTVAFIETIAREAGLRVGAYTSPHLLAYNERVRIDGEDVGDAALVEAFEAIEASRAGVTLTYFEYGTLAALWLFERAALDIAVLEVGLGGRLDATNIVDADVAVITTVDIDHQEYLGPDREAIGFEKAGIARAWKPLVLGDDDPPSSVLRRAYAIGASAVRIGCDFFFDAAGDGWRWREVGCEFELPLPQLQAPAQLRNAAVALAALRSLDIELPESAIARGVAHAQVRGRLQRFERDGVDVVLDVAHNPQAARQLADWLERSPPVGEVHAVFAALADKDVQAIVEALAPHVAHWHLAGLEGHGPRGTGVDALAERLGATPACNGTRHVDVAAALSGSLAAARPGDRVIVFGSFHTVADALVQLGAG
ncbi:bifunctional tetrahydrofolate synthase/dihydrofolate synthase [Lysobacter korlensis]|uniref:Dihydrofolate synthase/folylpolyglutamate synthase n=1 Tax=Lysobacter korlensis TaxID=553636 RepID=A0ABV6RLP1_9GAMM